MSIQIKRLYSPNYLMILLLVVTSVICIIVFRSWAQLPPPPKRENHPAWSPDGERLAYTCYINGPIEGESFLDVNFSLDTESMEPWSEYTDEAADICIIDEGGRNRVHLVQTPGADFAPAWSPDGSKIAYLRYDEGVFVVNTEENSQPQLLWSGGRVYPRNLAWSPAGTHLLFSACNRDTDLDIYKVSLDGQITNLTSGNNRQDISPKWIQNGDKIFFRSTIVSALSKVSSGVCYLLGDSPQQMKVIDVNGGNEALVLEELYYPYVAVSDAGQIAFVSDLVSKRQFKLKDSDRKLHLYITTVDNSDQVEMLVEDVGHYLWTYDTYSPVSWWSPDETRLLFQDGPIRLLDTRTTEVKQLPQISSPSFFPQTYIWSPDSQKLAVSGSNFLNSDYGEENIYLIDLQDGMVRPLLEDN